MRVMEGNSAGTKRRDPFAFVAGWTVTFALLLFLGVVSFAGFLLVAGVPFAYCYGIRVGMKHGYTKGGDDMVARFLI